MNALNKMIVERQEKKQRAPHDFILWRPGGKKPTDCKILGFGYVICWSADRKIFDIYGIWLALASIACKKINGHPPAADQQV